MKQQVALFKVLVKKNSKADKVLFYLTSYRAPWYIYALPIEKLRKSGYEVVIYDYSNRVLDNDDPQILINVVRESNEDIKSRIQGYRKRGIVTFDAVGNSLGSFFAYNYSVRYALRKVSLNTVSYLARVIFNSSDKNIIKIRRDYVRKGYNQSKLETAWKEIDSPELGSKFKAETILIFTALNDRYVAQDNYEEVVKNISLSNTKLEVVNNKKLGHSAAVLKNAYSKRLYKFLLDE